MRTSIIIAALLLICSACGTDQQTSNVKAYPVDWCIVTGEKLGSMGDPVAKTYQGQEVKFCCKYCIEEFEKTPALYLARIDSAATGLLKPAPSGEGHGG